MPIKENREYRSMELRAAQTEDKDFVVDGYATTFDSPYLLYTDGKYQVWEQVDKNAFQDTDQSDVIFQYDHAGMVYARTRNKTLQLSEDDHGLKVMAGGLRLIKVGKGGALREKKANESKRRNTLDDERDLWRTFAGGKDHLLRYARRGCFFEGHA